MAAKSTKSAMAKMSHGKINLAILPDPRFLHVVLHGLICVRLSQNKSTAALYFPEVDPDQEMMGHIYFGGSFDNLRVIPKASRFRLEVPSPQRSYSMPSMSSFKTNFLAVCLSEMATVVKSKFKPSKVHAVVELPWPDDIRRVRICGRPPSLAYNAGGFQVNPTRMGYVTYLTYLLPSNGHVKLRHHHENFWFSECLMPSNRLHFFADPPMAMTLKERASHIINAYQALDTQCFNPAFDLKEDTSTHPTWAPPDLSNADIPASEQVDLTTPLFPYSGHTFRLFSGGDVGNCLPPFVID
jgi:hypothetical protein